MTQQSINDTYKHIAGNAEPVITLSPITLSSDGRPSPLQVKISAPVTGTELPVIIFSHGFGNSMDGYAPLVHYWASHGFVVIQATHPDSGRLGNFDELPYKNEIWRIRIHDIKQILDQLQDIGNTFEGLKGRMATDQIAAVGHSFGGHTTSMLLGARMAGPDHQTETFFLMRGSKQAFFYLPEDAVAMPSVILQKSICLISTRTTAACRRLHWSLRETKTFLHLRQWDRSGLPMLIF